MPDNFTIGNTAALAVAISRRRDTARAKTLAMSRKEKKKLLRKILRKTLVARKQKIAEDNLFNLVTNSKGWGRGRKNKTRKNKTRKKLRKSRRKKNSSAYKR